MRQRRRAGRIGTMLILTIMLVLGAMGAAPAQPDSGYLTDQAPYITLDSALPSGSTVKGIINSGDVLGDFTFEGIPDGIGIRPGAEQNTVDVYVAHEQSTVPFRNARDVQDSSISRLTLDTKAGDRQGSVLSASVALGPELGYLRFCSAFMAGPNEGFSTYTFFTGEETNDVVPVPPGAPYGPDPAFAPNRQGGYAVALNTDTGQSTPIPGMGRLNHENTVVVPGGWDEMALLTTDDTFTAATSQLYLYLAADDQAVFDDEGSLWAMRVTSKNGVAVDPTDPFNGANDYLDLGVDDEMTAEFIPVPDAVADGTQDDLENWSNENNVFQWVRLEDAAYDKNHPRVVYVADTGASRVVPDPVTGRLARPSGAIGQADNGRVIKLVFSEDEPTVVDSVTVLLDGDAVGSDKYIPFTSPDNLDTSKKSLMIQEDTDNAQVFQYRLRQGTWRSVATVNDPSGESSGIVDASEWFGGGRWLLDVQGHGSNVFEADDNGILVKRESGQLMLMTIPGS